MSSSEPEASVRQSPAGKAREKGSARRPQRDALNAAALKHSKRPASASLPCRRHFLPRSVNALAQAAAQLGDVVQVVNTAGLSPVQASPEAILAVDLVGTAIFLDEFEEVIAEGGSGLVISSMAGHMIPALKPEDDHALAQTPTDELLALPLLIAIDNSGAAYAISKRANHLRVQAAAVNWGDHGARVNSISPGIILTPLARDEMSGAGAAGYQAMIKTPRPAVLAPPTRLRPPPHSFSERTVPSSRAPISSWTVASSQPSTRAASPCP